MVNEAEFAAMKAAKKAAKAAKAAGTAGEAKKQQRSEERKKRKVGESAESSSAAESSTAAPPHAGAADDDSTSAAYAVVNAASSSGPLHDKTISCVDCATDFLFSVAEQEFFLSQGYVSGKSRCKECTRAKKARFGEATDAASRRLETTTCLACGQVGHNTKTCTVKPLNCFNCGKTGHKSKDCPQVRDTSQVCFKFQQTGVCSRGDACRFAHVK